MTYPVSSSPSPNIPHLVEGEEGTQKVDIDSLAHWKAGIKEVKTFRGHTQGIWSVRLRP